MTEKGKEIEVGRTGKRHLKQMEYEFLKEVRRLVDLGMSIEMLDEDNHFLYTQAMGAVLEKNSKKFLKI